MRYVSRISAHNPRPAARDEQGFVMIMVLWLMVIALLVGIVLVAANISSSNITTRDARQSRTQQAADAGVQSELYEQGENQVGNAGSAFDLNGGLLGTNITDCLGVSLNTNLQITGLVGASATANSACPGPTGNPSGALNNVLGPAGDHAYYTARYFPQGAAIVSGGSAVELQPRIVSVGWDQENSNTVYSKEEAILNPIEPLPVLGGNDNIQVNGATISGGLLGGLLSLLGNILSNTSGLFSGLGIGSDTNLATVIDGDVTAANNVTLPSVDASLNLSLTNAYTSSTDPSGASSDKSLQGVTQLGSSGTLSPSGGITTSEVLHDGPPPLQPISVATSTPDCPSTNANCASFGSDYSSTTDDVTVPTGTSLVISPGEYVFCNFTEKGTATVTAEPSSTTPVEIFIDNPNSSRCSGNGTPTLSSTANSVTGHDEYNFGNFVAPNGINNGVGNVTGVLGPSGLQIYVVGDDPDASNPYDDDTYVQLGTPAAASSGGGLVQISTNPTLQSAVIYAPTSEVVMTTEDCSTSLLTTLCIPGLFEGNLIGDDVNASALVFEQDLDLGNYALYNGLNLYRVEKYVQCTPPTSTTISTSESTATSGC